MIQLLCGVVLAGRRINNHCASFVKLQALAGFEKIIKHLDEHLVDIGSKVSLNEQIATALHGITNSVFSSIFSASIMYNMSIPSYSYQGITKPKEVRKFKGEGMPLHFSNKKGDLYVTFEVVFPSSLTEEQKTKIREVLA